MGKANYSNVGGQAIMEGVMMRSPEKTVIAVRTPDNTIAKEEVEFNSLRNKYKFFRLPIIRGIVAFVESLLVGFGAISRSASLAGLEEETGGNKTTENIIMSVSFVLGLGLSLALLVFIPVGFRVALEYLFKFDFGMFRTLFEGIVKIGIFLLYMVLIAQMKDIKRLFQYHGAEHKTIFCYEAGEELTVENVRKHSRFHPRCGTSFIFVVMIVSILFFSVFSGLPNGIYTIIKIVFLPIVAGLSFEVTQFTAKYENLCTRILSAPGKWVQRISTIEPDDDQIEVAIISMKGALNMIEVDPPHKDQVKK